MVRSTQPRAERSPPTPGSDEPARKPRGRPANDSTDRQAALNFRSVVDNSSISRASDTPLWLQLKVCIEEAIQSGLLTKGSRLPSEQAICQLFGLSRPVVRSALSALAGEGFVNKQARKGVFVAGNRIETGFVTTNTSLFDDLSRKGHHVDFDTLDFAQHPANDTEQRVFSLTPDQDVVRLHRVYRIDGEPLTNTRIAFPEHRVPGIMRLEVGQVPILEFLKSQYDIRLQRADRWIKGALAPREVADSMGLPANTPLVEIESLAYDYAGNAVEYYHAFYNTNVSPLHIATDHIYANRL